MSPPVIICYWARTLAIREKYPRMALLGIASIKEKCDVPHIAAPYSIVEHTTVS